MLNLATDDMVLKDDPPTTELDLILDQFRDAACTATGALAVLLITSHTDMGGITPGGMPRRQDPATRLLQDAATAFLGRLRRPDTTPADAPARPDHVVGRAILRGQDLVTLCIRFDGPDTAADGIMAFAFDPARWRDGQTLTACRKLAETAHTLWRMQDDLSGLAYQLMTMSSRTARLQRLSETDALTQIDNRASFENKAQAALEHQPDEAAFVLIDIDHFKMINDIYGHQFGDTYLKTVARSLRGAFPEGSIVGRIGGDEFGVFTPLPAAGRAYLDGLLARCRSNIQRAIALLSKPDLGHVTIGASIYPEHATGYSALYELADTALYAAKNAGRGINAVYHPHLHVRYNSAELTKQFHRATLNGDIHPKFQPIVDLQTGDCAGFEVLARWRDASGREMIPSQFASIFRDHALAEKMTLTILRQAAADHAATLRRPGQDMRLNLNVTFFDLMNPEFAFEVQSIIAETGFDWNLLTIEVTEQIMLGEQNGQIFRTLGELRTRGAMIALDDFGTGYGGLRHLTGWPVDTLKIDKFFVDAIETGDRGRAVLDAVVELSRSLGLSLVAEGIETAGQAARLKEMGCQFGQGYLFDEPLSGAELADFRSHYAF